MGTEAKNLEPEAITFRAACREDTGRHMLDSGGAYGRSHENPDIPSDSPMTSLEFYGWDEETGEPEVGEYGPCGEIMATLHTGAFLDAIITIDHDLQAEFMEFASADDLRDEYGRLPDWFECLNLFMESRGFVLSASDNVYNGEYDLSQVYVWHVWEREGRAARDWIYSDDFIAAYFMHTGCDVRGGYGRPILSTEPAGEYSGEYTVPMDVVCGWWASPIDRPEEATPTLPGLPEAPDAAQDFCERINQGGEWSPGYSSYPVGEMLKYVRKCWPETYKGGETGVKVEVAYVPDGEYGISPGDGSADEIRVEVDLFAAAPMN